MADEVKGDIYPTPLDKLLPTSGIQKGKEDNNRDKKKKASKKTTKGTDAPGTGKTRLPLDDIKLASTIKSEGSTIDLTRRKPKLLKSVKSAKPKSPRKPVYVDLTENSTNKPTERKLSRGKLPRNKSVKTEVPTVEVEPPSVDDIKMDLKPTMFFKSASTPSSPSVFSHTFMCPRLNIIDDFFKDESREPVNKTVNLSFYF
jgi:hypothetical protein